MASDQSTSIPSMTFILFKLLESTLNGNLSFDTLRELLALVCLILILQKGQGGLSTYIPPSSVGTEGGSTNTASSAASNPLQKLLGDLTKNVGDGGGGSMPDALMSVLPILNNPQVKSKLTPQNIASVASLLTNFASNNSDTKSDKTEKPEKSKVEPKEKEDSSKVEKKNDPPAATITSQEAAKNSSSKIISTTEQEVFPLPLETENTPKDQQKLHWKNL